MPTQLTYPGVYVEEVPSGVRTIVGVSTSTTAFLGRAARGPVDTPVDVFSFEGFARAFGGVWGPSTLGYAVRDFFLNGGGHAVIVRLHNGATTAEITAGGLTLAAASAGTWGAGLRVAVTLDEVDAQLAQALGTTLFTLRVREVRPGGATETFHNLSVDDNHRHVGRVLERESALVRLPAGATPTAPTKGEDPLTVLADALAALKKPKDDGSGTVGTDDEITAKEKELRDATDAAVAAVGDGDALTAAQFVGGSLGARQGLAALDTVDVVNLLCIPPHRHSGAGVDLEPFLVASAAAYCEKRRAMLIVDPRADWKDPTKAQAWRDQIGTGSSHAALFFPRLRQADPERGGAVTEFAPCGAVAGVFARTDATRGVWKAPAGIEAALVGVPELSVKLDDAGSGSLNPWGVNGLRSLPAGGRVVWGSRTLAGADVLASEWKYVPVRRLALFLEESLFRGTQWVVFEPNDEPLWAQIRLNVGAFMHDLFRQGAFAGVTPREAYVVRCDKDTTTQSDRNKGIVNIVVGFAPLKPAEFVVIRLQQLAGQIET